MSRRLTKRLSLRTVGIIEQMHSRGISAISIAGDTRVRVDRVQAVIDRVEEEVLIFGKKLRNDGGLRQPAKLLDSWPACDHCPCDYCRANTGRA